MMKLSIIRLVKDLGNNTNANLLSLEVSKSIFIKGDYSKSFYIKTSGVDPYILIQVYESLKSDEDKKDFISQMLMFGSNDLISEILAGSADRDLVDYLTDGYKLKELHSLLKIIADKFGLEVEGVFIDRDENYRVRHIFEIRDNTQITDYPLYGKLYDIVECDNNGRLLAGDIIKTNNGLECIEKVEDGFITTCDRHIYKLNDVRKVGHKNMPKISIKNYNVDREIEMLKNAFMNDSLVYIDSSYNITTNSENALKKFDPTRINMIHSLINLVLNTRDEMKAGNKI